MPAVSIGIRSAATGAIRPAVSAADVITAIHDGNDILFNGQTATLTNMGGQWLIQGQPVETWFFTAPATGPTVAPVDQPVDPSRGGPYPYGPPDLPPVIRTDPFPLTAAGSLNLTPTSLIILAAAAYFLLRRTS